MDTGIQAFPTIFFPDFGTLKIATQVWEERTCTDADDASVDLRFQFGILNREQEDFIKTPANFAALTVRTDYDKVQLKGKGFIYVSPVHGRLSYRGALGKPDFWSKGDGANLYRILQHELGHIFGLPHFGIPGSLMSEGFAATFQTTPSGSLNQFLGFPKVKKVCAKALGLETLPDLYKELFNLKVLGPNCSKEPLVSPFN